MNSPIALEAGDRAVQFGVVEHIENLSFGGQGGAIGDRVSSGQLKVEIGSLNGAVVNFVAADLSLPPTPRTTRLRLTPSTVPNLVGRRECSQLAINRLIYEQPIEFYGMSGIGKTSLLRYLANHPTLDSTFIDGVIYHHMSYRQTIADLLQMFFDAFYECKTPLKVSALQIRQALSDKKVLVMLDGLQFTREEVNQLLTELPSFTFVLSGSDRHLWEAGQAIKLPGLDLKESLFLVTQTLGYDLSPAERIEAEKVCTALEGHPLRILQVTAWVQDENQSWATIAQHLSQSPEELPRRLVAALPASQRSIIQLLAVLGTDVTVTAELIEGVIELPDAKRLIEDLLNRNLIERDGEDIRLASDEIQISQQPGNPNVWMERVNGFLMQWVKQHETSPKMILKESDVVLRTLQWAREAGRWGVVIALGRSIEGALALSSQVGTWEIVLEAILQAAQAVGDSAVEAFALHELGARSLCLNDANQAQAYFSQALEIRTGLGDPAAIEATTTNLQLRTSLTSAPSPEPAARFMTQPLDAIVPAPDQSQAELLPVPRSQPNLPLGRWLGGGVLLGAFVLGFIVFNGMPRQEVAPNDPIIPVSPPPTEAEPSLNPEREPERTPDPITPSIKPSESKPLKVILEQPVSSTLQPGESTKLCYSIENASTASLTNYGTLNLKQPCVTVAPTTTTTYSITASDKNNQTKTSNEITITVEEKVTPVTPTPTTTMMLPQSQKSQSNLKPSPISKLDTFIQ